MQILRTMLVWLESESTNDVGSNSCHVLKDHYLVLQLLQTFSVEITLVEKVESIDHGCFWINASFHDGDTWSMDRTQ